jgi:hypothetical protein
LLAGESESELVADQPATRGPVRFVPRQYPILAKLVAMQARPGPIRNPLLREDLAIKDSRWERSPSRRRPHYTPIQRMRILQLRSARGWTIDKTARVFLPDEQTLLEWMSRTPLLVGDHGFQRQRWRQPAPSRDP